MGSQTSLLEALCPLAVTGAREWDVPLHPCCQTHVPGGDGALECHLECHWNVTSGTKLEPRG